MSNTKNCLPQTTSQTSGGKFQTFSNLNNIKKKEDYAQAQIHGKKQPLNRPSTITVKKFTPNLPNGALATKVTVKIKHSIAPINNKNCNITAPTITLMNGNSSMRWSQNNKPMSKKLKAPTTTAKEYSVSFGHSWNYNELNSNDFGVKIDYPTNSNDNEGYIRIYYVQIVIEYRTANFTLQTVQSTGEYNGDNYTISITCNNINNTRIAPTVTIDAPLGFSLKEFRGKGKFVTVSARTFTWTPKIGLNVGSDVITLIFEANVSFSGSSESTTARFNASESIGSHSTSKTVTILKTRPVDPTVDDVPDEPVAEPSITEEETEPTNPVVISLEPSQLFDFELDIFEEYESVRLFCCSISNGYFDEWNLNNLSSVMRRYDRSTGATSFQTYTNLSYTKEMYQGKTRYAIQIETTGTYTLVITPSSSDLTVLGVVYLEIRPYGIGNPAITVLTPTQEELNRLGNGYNYTVESMLKLTSDEGYVRDWTNNFRIAVFNNAIKENISTFRIKNEDDEYEDIIVDTTDYDCLTPLELFNHAEYWSSQITKPNEYQNIEVKFPYNKEYPLHVLIIGDCINKPSTVNFTEPVIVETDYYNGRTKNGLYPIPILDLIGEDTTSEISIEALGQSDTLIFYDFPLSANFGTNEEIVVRGLALEGLTDSNTDNLRLSANLVNNQNESKQRSVILDEFESVNFTDNEFKIGQVGDSWGFKPSEIQNLEDWEVHLLLSNVLNDFDAHAFMGEIRFIVYYEEIVTQNIKCFVECEDLGYYSAFITNVTIPEGLKTDTDYITVDGTDVNDPYRQNIRGKTIEIEFDVGDNCDLEGSTLSLNELKKLFTNERDKYHRPIPKRIEFSHYPDVFWEFIMEEPIDADINISSYHCKVKLEIPHGTSYDKDVTSTAETGYVSGLAGIYPIIQVLPTDSVFSIMEIESGQEFNMGYGGNWTGKIVEIDCEDRIVWLKESEDDDDPVNISGDVDINSDWFVLHGEYEFQPVGCVIRAVNWQERW